MIQNPIVHTYLCMFFSVIKMNTGKIFLCQSDFFSPFIGAGMIHPSIHRKTTLFYHYLKHGTAEDETLHVFGAFGETKQALIVMEFA